MKTDTIALLEKIVKGRALPLAVIGVLLCASGGLLGSQVWRQQQATQSITPEGRPESGNYVLSEQSICLKTVLHSDESSSSAAMDC